MRLLIISSFILILLLIFKCKIISAYGRIYTSNEGRTYYIETDRKFTWTEAVIKCMELDMTLMSVDTKEKANEIDQLFKKEFNKTTHVWLDGIMSRYPKHHFVWLSTGKEFNYTNWEKDNPNFQEKQQFCVEFGFPNMEWNDLHCQRERGFMCENQSQQKQLQQDKEKQQKLNEEIENLRTLLKRQNEKYEEKEIKYKLELENYRKQLKDEMEKQQNMQKELHEKYQQEKLLQKELPEREKLLREILNILKINLKQQEEKHSIDTNVNKQEQLEKLQERSDIKYRDFILHLHQDRYSIN